MKRGLRQDAELRRRDIVRHWTRFLPGLGQPLPWEPRSDHRIKILPTLEPFRWDPWDPRFVGRDVDRIDRCSAAIWMGSLSSRLPRYNDQCDQRLSRQIAGPTGPNGKAPGWAKFLSDDQNGVPKGEAAPGRAKIWSNGGLYRGAEAPRPASNLVSYATTGSL